MPGTDAGLGEQTTEAGPDAPVSAAWDRVQDLLERSRQGAGDSRLGHFVVEGVLGRGGMGVVVAAHDPRLDRKVALKLVDESRSDAIGEARALARLSHPHIVAVYEVGEVEGVPFIAMELVEGRTLRAWLEAEDAPDHRTRLAAFLAIARGLQAAHEAGIVHRDFKPDNVLVGTDGRPRVVDFGLSQLREVGDAPRLVGTPAYMAPEQWYGRTADARSDQFAFCVALYEALYGQRPFPGDSLAALLQRVTEGEPEPVPAAERGDAALRAAVLRGLRKDPAERWPAMSELAAQLEDAMGRMQPGLVDRPPPVLAIMMLTNLTPALAWLGLELAGLVEYSARAWWGVSTVQLSLVGMAFLLLRGRIVASFRSPRVAVFPAVFVPVLLGHRLIAWATESSFETMFVYDFLIAAAAGWTMTLLIERGLWPVVLLGLTLTTLGMLEPSWAPHLWLGIVLGPPLLGALAVRSAHERRARVHRVGPSTRR